MKLNEFPYFAPDVINLISEEDPSGLQENHSVQLMAYNGEWLLQQVDTRVAVSCIKDTRLLESLVQRDQTRWMLAQTQKQKQKNTLQLQYLAPVEITRLDLQLGVDGLISDDLFTKNEIRENSIEQACKWLNEHFVVVSHNPSGSGNTEERWLTISRFSNSGSGNGFQLLGKGWRADVEDEQDGRYLIKRITRHPRRDSAFSLLIGTFSFADVSATAALQSATHRAMLSAALRDNGSYLELWNLYNDKEWAIALKRAETLKALRFTHSEAFEDGRTNRWRIWPTSAEAYKEYRERWSSLDIQKSEQVDLSFQSPDWAEELNTEAKPSEQQNPRGEIRFESDHIIFTPSSDRWDAIPRFGKQESGDKGGGWLYLSLAGQRTIGKRRLSARQTIDAGERMPQLKGLLEGVPMPTDRRRKIKGLTPYVKETFKGGKPTDKQLLALEKALNTPDIAIIIGPPGTGKTQVIAALQRRLAEISEEQNLTGQVLVSSFQHDAVDNALDRSLVFNLPATRVGGKKQSTDEESGFSRWIDMQASYLKEQIEQQYQKFPALKQLDGLALTLTQLRVSQFSAVQYVDTLQQVLSQLTDIEAQGIRISARLVSELDEYIEEQRQVVPATQSVADHRLALRCIRGLRVTDASFTDDGCARAEDLLRELRRRLHHFTADSQELLETASKSHRPDSKLLQALTRLQNQLLDQYLPDFRPPELKRALDQTGQDLLNRLEDALDQQMQQRKQGVAWALQELVSSIETDRSAALKTTEAYAMVVGATCQQAASNKMVSVKELAGTDSSGIEFDTVIIDEAARANPLDLFIPMSMAKRRVILVGDDRQLPHMLEPDIEGQLQEEHKLTEQQLEAFKSSLFERLRLQVEPLKDFTRVVMLDTQFRMHPILGDFVSQQFYESIGMGKVTAGRQASDFGFDPEFVSALGPVSEHYDGKVCQWIDVPLSEGKSGKRGTSRIREAEAERVAAEVKSLFEAAGNSLSVGVITFYAAQRDLIMEKLAACKVNGIPLMVKRDGQFEPSAEFATTEKGEEGLRVGSVDAFQGKEFDVVLLSCVRTWYKSKPSSVEAGSEPASESHEIQLNRMFGFLRLPNRMNVAMSRQREMLICVGDSKLATNDYAEEGVPALNAFYQLCGGEYGSLR